MTSKTDPETARLTCMNSNGCWYTASLLADGVRVSLDYDDKKKAQEVADAHASDPSGVLTFVRYESITDLFADHGQRKITDDLVCLAGAQSHS